MDENYIETDTNRKDINSKVFKSIKIPAKNSYWEKVYKFLKLFIQRLEASNKEIAQLLLASEEIFSNISKYAYPDEAGDVELKVEYDKLSKELKLNFQDRGVPFNPCLNSNPDISQSFKDRKIGGLGLYIVHQIADSIKYENIEGRNQLTILKKINKEE